MGLTIQMKTSFATAAIAATYIAISVQGQNMPRFLNDTCEVETIATAKNFMGEESKDTMIIGHNLWLKGRNERALCIDEYGEIEMGHDNRAWVLKGDGSSVPGPNDTLQPNFLGGSLRFEVDVNELGCNCAAGVFLVALDGEECKKGVYEGTAQPQCSSINVMKANTLGFSTASRDCKDGYCNVDNDNMCKTVFSGSMEYGPGTEYTINTEEPYKVSTHFATNDTNKLDSIRTILI